MRKDLTDITVILDRSGSMQACKADAEGGLNAFVEKQKAEPGEAAFTLVQFDTQYEFVHNGVPIQNVPPFVLEPRGGTALLDAVGRTIHETGVRLAALPEDQRPGLVLLLIITDGEENSSREYDLAKVKAMITHQQDVYKWQFSYLGANQDAFAAGAGMGIAAAGTANYREANTYAAHDMQARRVSRMRAMSFNDEPVNPAFLAEEIDAMQKE